MQKLLAVALVFGVMVFGRTAPCQDKSSEGTPAGAGASTTLSPAARDKIVRQARQSYYSLQALGMKEFRCQVVADWNAMYGDAPLDAVGREQLLPILKSVDFQVTVGPTGAALVSYRTDAAPASEEVAGRARQAIGGMEQVLSGFFQTWSQFIVLAPLPEPGAEYELEEAGGKYRLTQNDSSGEALIVMNHDLVIEHTEVQSAKVTGSVDPVFTAGKGGLMLSGYEASVKDPQGQTQRVTVKNTYQTVNGFELPRTLNAIITLPPDTKIDIPLTFANCVAKGK